MFDSFPPLFISRSGVFYQRLEKQNNNQLPLISKLSLFVKGFLFLYSFSLTLYCKKPFLVNVIDVIFRFSSQLKNVRELHHPLLVFLCSVMSSMSWVNCLICWSFVFSSLQYQVTNGNHGIPQLQATTNMKLRYSCSCNDSEGNIYDLRKLAKHGGEPRFANHSFK